MPKQTEKIKTTFSASIFRYELVLAINPKVKSVQKQPPEVFLEIHKIHWKTPVPVSFLIKLQA